MGEDRESALKRALLEGGQKSPAAKARRRKKQETQRPWKVLEDEWHEQMRQRFGRTYDSSKWGKESHEPKLARALLSKVELELVIRMVRRFIRQWNKEGTPGFGYFWKVKDSLKAQELGQAKTREQRLMSGEYDSAQNAHLPKIGW